MKISFAILLIVIFIGTAVFSALAMGHNPSHIKNGCIASIAKGTDCPKTEESILAFLNFHLEIFRNFSTAIFAGALGGLILSLAVLFSVLTFVVFAKFRLKIDYFSNWHKQFLESYSFAFQKEFLQWIAFHKNSPNFALLRRRY